MLRRWRILLGCWLVAGLLTGGLLGVPAASAAALAAESVWSAAESALAERLATEDKTVSYRWERFSSLPETFIVPDGQLTLEARVPNGVRYGSPTAVHVLVKNGDVRLYDWQLTFQVKKFAYTVVAARDLAAGAPLAAADLRIEERDVTRIRGELYQSVEEAVGLEPVRALPVGSLVSEVVVRAPLLVKQGETVRLLVRYGAVTVETTAEAMTGGRNGMLVRVKNLTTGKVIAARVTARGLVEALAR